VTDEPARIAGCVAVLDAQVIVEEVPKMLDSQSKSKTPQRYIGGVVTPSSPIYEHSLSDPDGFEQSCSTTRPLLGEGRASSTRVN
jgi:hypothetical protein